MSFPHTAIVTETGLRFEHPQAVQSYIRAQWGVGEVILFTLHDYSERRSLLQNAYLHAEPIRKFCLVTGNTPAQQKIDLLGEYFGWKQLPSGHWAPERASTSELTKREFSEWIEWIPSFGASWDPPINILLPEKDPEKRDPRMFLSDAEAR